MQKLNKVPLLIKKTQKNYTHYFHGLTFQNGILKPLTRTLGHLSHPFLLQRLFQTPQPSVLQQIQNIYITLKALYLQSNNNE